MGGDHCKLKPLNLYCEWVTKAPPGQIDVPFTNLRGVNGVTKDTILLEGDGQERREDKENICFPC